MRIQENIKNISGFPDDALLLDANNQELTHHGTDDFPFACYMDRYRGTFFPWHWHDELEFGWVEQGTLNVAVNERRYTLEAGSGFFVNSGVLHSYTGMGSAVCLVPNIVFHPALIYGTQKSVFWIRYMRPILGSATLSHAVFSQKIPWQREALEHIRAAYALGCAGEPGFELQVRNHLSDLMLLIFSNCSDTISAPNDPIPQEINRIRRMIDFIECHYTEPITLAQIAEAAAVSERECLRCFRHVIGQSPKQYVLDRRIRRAYSQLLHSNCSLSEIGEACGFQSQSYFIKMFRRAAGMSPGEFRRGQKSQK